MIMIMITFLNAFLRISHLLTFLIPLPTSLTTSFTSHIIYLTSSLSTSLHFLSCSHVFIIDALNEVFVLFLLNWCSCVNVNLLLHYLSWVIFWSFVTSITIFLLFFMAFFNYFCEANDRISLINCFLLIAVYQW
jgi:hypothetical protein